MVLLVNAYVEDVDFVVDFIVDIFILSLDILFYFRGTIYKYAEVLLFQTTLACSLKRCFILPFYRLL